MPDDGLLVLNDSQYATEEKLRIFCSTSGGGGYDVARLKPSGGPVA